MRTSRMSPALKLESGESLPGVFVVYVSNVVLHFIREAINTENIERGHNIDLLADAFQC